MRFGGITARDLLTKSSDEDEDGIEKEKTRMRLDENKF